MTGSQEKGWEGGAPCDWPQALLGLRDGLPAQPLGCYAFRRLVRDASRALAEAGVSSPESDARALAELVVGRPLVMVDDVGAAEAARFLTLIARRAVREPLQLITGRMWFRGLELRARPGVFIVRPETEVVAGAAIDAARGLAREGAIPGERADGGAARHLAARHRDARHRDAYGASVRAASGAVSGEAALVRGPLVVDLCTGSGAIAAAVAAEVPEARVVAVEIDAAAAALARENCERLAPGRVEVVQADATAPATLAALDGTVDIVVSNPPYVPAGAVEDPETARHDPERALLGGGAEGLAVPTAVVRRSAALLRPGGLLVMEHDAGQGAALRAVATAAGLRQVRTGQDLTGRGRYLRARR